MGVVESGQAVPIHLFLSSLLVEKVCGSVATSQLELYMVNGHVFAAQRHRWGYGLMCQWHTGVGWSVMWGPGRLRPNSSKVSSYFLSCGLEYVKQTNKQTILCVCVGMYLSVCLPVHQHVHVHTQVFIEAKVNLGCSFSDVVTVTVGFF